MSDYAHEKRIVALEGMREKIAALEAENAKLRAVVEMAKHYVKCDEIGDCMAQGNAWIDLQDMLKRLGRE